MSVHRLIQQLRTRGVRGYLRYKMEKLRQDREEERHALAFYSQFVRRGSLCFDVGANHGDRTRLFLKLGARVVCVEPQPACARAMRKRLPARRVAVEESAVGRREGVAEMQLSNLDVLATLSPRWISQARLSGRFGDVRWDKTITVRVTTLDSIIARHGSPDFIKIDVEGFEAEALGGMTAPAGSLSFEFVRDDLAAVEECLEHLSRLGYCDYNVSLGESLRMELDRPVDGAALLTRLQTGIPPGSWGDVYALRNVRTPAG